MRYCLILVLTVLVILVGAGCNPVGMDNTRVYVRGLIYTDSTHTAYAQNVGIMTLDTPESYITSTGADGRFWIEIQMYPDSSGSNPGSVKFGLKAFSGKLTYSYGCTTGKFTVFGGDTLTVYDVDLDMFTASQGGLGGF